MNAPPNNSMDVRAKQRLSYRVVRQTLAGLVAVSPHVISSVKFICGGATELFDSKIRNCLQLSAKNLTIEFSRTRRSCGWNRYRK